MNRVLSLVQVGRWGISLLLAGLIFFITSPCIVAKSVQPPGAVVKAPLPIMPAPKQTKPTTTKPTAANTAKTAVTTSTAGSSAALAKAPQLNAAAAVLLDASTGRVLYAVNAHTRRAPASLTKLVTAIVAVEKGNLSSVARISTNAASKPPTRLGLQKGDRIRLSKLLDAALMGSDNDAATAIAEHIAGSESAFAKIMNETARKLGAKESNFRNPHGLDTSGHYSTAYDLALIARHALANPTLANVFTKQQVNLSWEGGSSQVANINSFLWRYKGALGLKTGYTKNAGYSVAIAAENKDRTLIGILLGCSSSEARWADAARLMDYGFSYYQSLVSAASQPQGRIYVVKAGDTLSAICRRLGLTLAQLMQVNKPLAQNPNRLIPGQVLVLP